MEFYLVKKVTKLKNGKIELLEAVDNLKLELDELFEYTQDEEVLSKIEIRKQILEVYLKKISETNFNDKKELDEQKVERVN